MRKYLRTPARQCRLAASLMTLLAFVSVNATAETYWSYSGETGPEHWGSLDPAYSLCAKGTIQSPVDLSDATSTDLSRLQFDYHPDGREVVNTGHSMQINYAAGSRFTLDDQVYELKQIHFHAPSEHTIDGRRYSMEAHLVHQDSQGTIAVIAVMFDFEEDNIADLELEKFWDRLPVNIGETLHLADPVDAWQLLPDDHEYFRYRGSLTTPPCSEGVLWLVMEDHKMTSIRQVRRLSTYIGVDNNRPLQPLNGRIISE